VIGVVLSSRRRFDLTRNSVLSVAVKHPIVSARELSCGPGSDTSRRAPADRTEKAILHYSKIYPAGNFVALAG